MLKQLSLSPVPVALSSASHLVVYITVQRLWFSGETEISFWTVVVLRFCFNSACVWNNNRKLINNSYVFHFYGETPVCFFDLLSQISKSPLLLCLFVWWLSLIFYGLTEFSGNMLHSEQKWMFHFYFCVKWKFLVVYCFQAIKRYLNFHRLNFARY